MIVVLIILFEDGIFLVLQIMGRKANPNASYLEIKKQLFKRKGMLVEIKEVP